jgi:pilus assembly protein CpaC
MTRKNIWLQIFISFVSVFGCVAAMAAELNLKINEGHLIRLSEPVQDVLITNSDIADIQLTQRNNLFIYGKTPGVTHIVALSENDKILFDSFVRVKPSFANVLKLITDKYPSAVVEIETSPGRVILTGDAGTPAQLAGILSLVEGVIPPKDKIINNMSLSMPTQVNLKVRVMEMNRLASRQIGLNWNAILNPGGLTVQLANGVISNTLNSSGASHAVVTYKNGGGSITSVIDAMVEDELITVLAEPNLTSQSGTTANFFAGGEFPIPVSSQNNQITVTFKKFGIILNMTPTVLSTDKIRLHIQPEVSELSSAGAVILQGITIPAISIRRTDATIELANGQSFVVAGMLQNQKRDLINKVPWLGDLDVLGPLFRSEEYQSEETELIIIATANIVNPVSKDRLRSPLDLDRDREFSIKRKNQMPRNLDTSSEYPVLRQKGGLKLNGPRGFMVEGER